MNAIDAIPTFKAGNHRGQPYTAADLDDMVANFAACSTGDDPPLRVPLVIGHDESQELLARSDLPAAGWVVAVRRVGDELYVDAEDVADLPAELIRGRRYRKVSAEVYDEPPPGLEGLCRGKVLRRVALLGGDIPEVKGLGDIPMPRRMSEGWAALDPSPGRSLVCGHAVALPGGCWAVFSELRGGMGGADRQDLIDRLARHGWDTSLVSESVSDALLGEMLRALDSKQQAVDADRDGQADSTQYEARPPVESVKDGQAIPDGGFAEGPPDGLGPRGRRMMDRADGYDRWADRFARYAKSGGRTAEDAAGYESLSRDDADDAARIRAKGRRMFGQDSGFAEGDSFDSPKARRAVRDLEQRMEDAATDSPAARGDYYRAERALIRTEGDIRRGIDRPQHPGLTGHAESGPAARPDPEVVAALLDAGFGRREAEAMAAEAAAAMASFRGHAEGGQDYAREERIRLRRRAMAGGGQRPADGSFGETCVRRHSETGGGGAMANGSDPGLAAVFDRAVRQAVGEMRATMMAEFTKIAEGVKAEAAKAKDDVQKFSEQQERARRIADADAFLHEMTMGARPRLTPRARDEQRAVALTLDDAAVVRKFSEDGREVELTAYAAWKRGIEALPVIERFAELAGTDGQGEQAGLSKEEREIHRAFSENVGGARAFATAEAAVESFRLQKQACPTVTPDEFLGK